MVFSDRVAPSIPPHPTERGDEILEKMLQEAARFLPKLRAYLPICAMLLEHEITIAQERAEAEVRRIESEHATRGAARARGPGVRDPQSSAAAKAEVERRSWLTRMIKGAAAPVDEAAAKEAAAQALVPQHRCAPPPRSRARARAIPRSRLLALSRALGRSV